MIKELSILTERQSTAYLLREQGLSYREIGERMDVSPSTVRQLVVSAERRFREFEEYRQERTQNNRSVDFPLTRGELAEIVSGLLLLEREMLRQVGGANVKNDFLSRLPYRAQLVSGLCHRAQAALKQFDERASMPDQVD